MKCPTCNKDTPGRMHPNGRGLRCNLCWAVLPEPEVKPEPVPVVVKAPPKAKAPVKKPASRRGVHER